MLAAVYFIVGPRAGQNYYNDFMNKGTIRGVYNCVEINKINDETKEELANYCMKQHEQLLESSTITSTMELRPDQFFDTEAYLKVVNKSYEFYVTRAETKIEYSSFGLVWEDSINVTVKPGEESGVEIRLKDSKNLTTQWCSKEETQGSCFLPWSLKLYGVSID